MVDSKTAGNVVNPEIAQTERIGLGDLVISGSLAVLTLFFSFIWHFPGQIPSMWNDVAVASGVRPAAEILPGFCGSSDPLSTPSAA